MERNDGIAEFDAVRGDCDHGDLAVDAVCGLVDYLDDCEELMMWIVLGAIVIVIVILVGGVMRMGSVCSRDEDWDE